MSEAVPEGGSSAHSDPAQRSSRPGPHQGSLKPHWAARVTLSSAKWRFLGSPLGPAAPPRRPGPRHCTQRLTCAPETLQVEPRTSCCSGSFPHVGSGSALGRTGTSPNCPAQPPPSILPSAPLWLLRRC